MPILEAATTKSEAAYRQPNPAQTPARRSEAQTGSELFSSMKLESEGDQVKNGRLNFDALAASWDDEPGRIKLAKDIFNAIQSEISLTSDTIALDFGCGTGLLTLPLGASVGSMTGVDTSRGMLDIVQSKVEKQGMNHVRCLFLDLENGGALEGEYDLIVSSMTFHHVEQIKPLLTQFYNLLRPSGFICLADLDPEEGRFHGDNTGVFHFGFDRNALRRDLEEVGFRSVRHRTAATVVKPTTSGKDQAFTVFLLVGERIS
jgi:2-polyprenyl-3-methyl-5-hydroxy-6-metoxy-1,4-benzoquinol methylase